VIDVSFFQVPLEPPLTSREWGFYLHVFPHNTPETNIDHKGEDKMPEQESKQLSKNEQAIRNWSAPHISLDILAVATGLLLVLLVRLGAIKHIPW